MENNTGVNTLMKSRSTAACIKAGYGLYADSFRKTISLSWSTAMLYAALFCILGTTSVTHLPPFMTTVVANIGKNAPLINYQHVILLTGTVFTIILGGIIEIVFYSYGMSVLRAHANGKDTAVRSGRHYLDRHTAWRTIKAAASCLLICAVPATAFVAFFCYRLRLMLAAPQDHILTLALTAVAAIAVILLLLPLCYISFKYIMRDDTRFWPLLRSDYATGLRHLPIIAATMFVNIVVIIVTSYVILQPAVILFMANTQANLGTVYGDPLGMPDHMIETTMAVFLIAGFLQAYIRLSALFTAYYMYGSIETQETEHKQYNTLNIER